MQTTVEDLSPVKKKLGVALPPEEFRAELDQAYRGLQLRARIKGFRPGKVPRPVLERYYGEQVQSEVVGKLIQESFARALAEHRLQAVARPEIVTEEIRPENGLRYSATFEVRPEFEVAGADGLEVARTVEPVTDDAIDHQLERLRESLAHMVPLSGRETIEAGDLVEIGYTGVADGRVVQGASVKSRVIEIGAQVFPPPVEERLIGRRRGESLHVDVAYPATHHHREIAGKTVTFRIEVKEIGAKELPVLDDEFAKDHGECGSLAELRERIRRDLGAVAEREADERVRSALVAQLTARNPVAVPEALVERRFEAMERELGLHGARASGDAELDAKIERVRAELVERARASVHAALVLDRLAVQQGLEVADREIDERIAAIVHAAPRERERLAELYRSPDARHEVGERLAQEKALQWLVAHARVTPGTAQT